ncbi:GNAT family N-acetyltransferase [Ferrimonas pelagia]|uniref:GNAT family N-acetyltransferase n=1 Tax=Ferrimonas pelagia TaxID=1177826 RepID=A0ABP9EC70_9GAMM
MTTKMPVPVRLRPVQVSDRPFLQRLYYSLREEEFEQAQVTPADRLHFLEQQFQAQQHHYFTHYCTDHFYLVEIGAVPAGRLFVDYWRDQIRIVDIALLEPYRGKGIGGQLLNQVLSEGRARHLPVTIHVEKYNPALALYQRLGFEVIGVTNEVYYLMQWSP